MSDVNFDFRGKNFAVVGASSGIGKQIALDLLDSGANVLVLARRKELMDEIYGGYADRVVTAKLDVLEQDNLDDVLKKFVSVKGKFNGSVYVSGVVHNVALRTLDMERIRQMMDTNFIGAVEFLSRISRSANVSAGSSHVWITSIAAHLGVRGVGFYAASKSAMLSAMKALACEISKKKHRLNAVSPGWIPTNLTEVVSEKLGLKPEERKEYANYILGLGTPADVSGAVSFLLSDRARWITGIEIVVDGGCLAS